MSIGKRFWDLARSNLSDFRSAFSSDEGGLTEEERQALDQELREKGEGSVGSRAGKAARTVRDAAEDAWERAYEAAQARAGNPGLGGRVDPEKERLKWYKTLEVEPGADFDTIRKSYRRLLKQYHPDRFARDPEKHKVATEVTRKITEAYDGLSTLHGR
ncbi:MAG TPA: J domain-containing protein [Nannocystaceae bacterium]|nr:J domain-containing protein [Nannocystaceae bacterium]